MSEDGSRYEKLLVRLEPELAAALRRWAEAEERSTSQQIRYVLRQATPVEHFLEPREGDAA